MNEIYVIHRGQQRIVNCITTSKTVEEVKQSFANVWPFEVFDFSTQPPQQMLEGYEFWNTRP